jgi:hypothetical protein
MMMHEDVLAVMPSSGMTPKDPTECLELLKLCTVMNWRPRLPLDIMRDVSAGRWFMRGEPGAQDYWIRDVDIDNLKRTPMWVAVGAAKPYGIEEIKPLEMSPVSPQLRELGERLKWDKEAMMKAMLEGLPLPPKPPKIPPKIAGRRESFILVDDPLNEDQVVLTEDPVEIEKRERAKWRLDAEERIKKMDQWDD